MSLTDACNYRGDKKKKKKETKSKEKNGLTWRSELRAQNEEL